jgi:hypothetical protein
VTAILKTWPAFMSPKKVLEVFTHDWPIFYFTLGRGKPRTAPTQLYFTHHGRILGHFDIEEVVQNSGQLPKLRSISDRESEWQIKPDRWVAICEPPFHRLEEKIYHEGFRSWRYFDLDRYRDMPESKVRL